MKKNVFNPLSGKFDLIDTQNIEEVLQQPTSEPNGIYVINITSGVASLVPATGQAVGSIQQYASAIGIPTNELILTGDLITKQEIDKIAYAALYAVIGDFHGVPLVGTNFVLPPIVGLLPKGGTVLNYTDNGGSNILLTSQLPQHRHSLFVNSDTASSDVAAGNYLSSSESSSGAGLMSSSPTNLEIANTDSIGLTGSGLPHEHPYQNFIFTICFESVAYGGVSPTPSLQQVSDVGFNSTNRLQFNTINYALVTDIVPALTPEEVQDAAFAILTDTATIDLTYNDVANTVTADVIDNSITNVKLAKMPSYTVIGNEFDSIEDAQYLPLQPVKRGKLSLIAGQRTVNDIRITITSFAYAFFTSNGNITAIQLRADIQNGYVTFYTGDILAPQITDTGEFSYEIQF